MRLYISAVAILIAGTAIFTVGNAAPAMALSLVGADQIKDAGQVSPGLVRKAHSWHCSVRYGWVRHWHGRRRHAHRKWHRHFRACYGYYDARPYIYYGFPRYYRPRRLYRGGPRYFRPRLRSRRGFRGPRFRGPRFRGPRVRGLRARGPRISGPRFRGPRIRGPRIRGPRARPRGVIRGGPNVR